MSELLWSVSARLFFISWMSIWSHKNNNFWTNFRPSRTNGLLIFPLPSPHLRCKYSLHLRLIQALLCLWNVRFSVPWLWRWPSSGTWRHVGWYLRTCFLEEPAASIFGRRRQQVCPKWHFLPECTALHLRGLCVCYVATARAINRKERIHYCVGSAP